MRPIDADELKKDLGEVLMNLMKSHETSRIEKVGFALDVVDEAETLDVAPVVRCKDCKRRFLACCKDKPKDYFCAEGERSCEHGMWVYNAHACGYYYSGWLCSECFNPEETKLKECPRCGAKMDGDE